MSQEPDKKALIPRLVRLGLSPSQAEVYLLILERGGVVRESEVKEEILRALAGFGLVREEVALAGERLVVASHPRIGLGGLFLRGIWAAHPLGASTAAEQTLLAEKESGEFLDDLGRSVGSFLQMSETPALVAYNSADDLASALSDAIASARREICGITARGWLANLPLVWQAITNALRAGVAYRRVSDLHTWIAWGTEINRRDVIELGIEVRVAIDALLEKVYVLDRSSCFVFETGHAPGAFESAATKTTNKELVQRFVERFDRVWDSCIDAARMIEASESVGAIYADRVRNVCPGELGVALEVFKFGVYYEPNDSREAVEHLVKAGLVRRVDSAFGANDRVMPAIYDDLLAALGRIGSGDRGAQG